MGHKSHEWNYDGDEPEHKEVGVSCYNNPWDLWEYLCDRGFYKPEELDIVIFGGSKVDDGYDDEDIVEVGEDCVIYSFPATVFDSFLIDSKNDPDNEDNYNHNKSIKEFLDRYNF